MRGQETCVPFTHLHFVACCKAKAACRKAIAHPVVRLLRGGTLL